MLLFVQWFYRAVGDSRSILLAVLVNWPPDIVIRLQCVSGNGEAHCCHYCSVCNQGEVCLSTDAITSVSVEVFLNTF